MPKDAEFDLQAVDYWTLSPGDRAELQALLKRRARAERPKAIAAMAQIIRVWIGHAAANGASALGRAFGAAIRPYRAP